MAQFYFKQEAKILGQSPNITRREPKYTSTKSKRNASREKIKKREKSLLVKVKELPLQDFLPYCWPPTKYD